MARWMSSLADGATRSSIRSFLSSRSVDDGWCIGITEPPWLLSVRRLAVHIKIPAELGGGRPEVFQGHSDPKQRPSVWTTPRRRGPCVARQSLDPALPGGMNVEQLERLDAEAFDVDGIVDVQGDLGGGDELAVSLASGVEVKLDVAEGIVRRAEAVGLLSEGERPVDHEADDTAAAGIRLRTGRRHGITKAALDPDVPRFEVPKRISQAIRTLRGENALQVGDFLVGRVVVDVDHHRGGAAPFHVDDRADELVATRLRRQGARDEKCQRDGEQDWIGGDVTNWHDEPPC